MPHTSTYALTNATLAVRARARDAGRGRRTCADPELAEGVNTVAGEVTNAAVAEALGRPLAPLADALAA